jgi:molecular chaperone GrpE
MQSSPGTDRDPATGAERAPAGPDDGSAEELRSQLEQMQAELAAMEDRLLRARADLENFRRRADREVERRVREERDELLLAWLEVVDSVDRAFAFEAAEPRLAGALRAFLDQMEAILARQGVRRMGGVGERFDPEQHEAVAAVRDPRRASGTIVDVARSGYSVGDRVLRPAQVAVAHASDDGD